MKNRALIFILAFMGLPLHAEVCGKFLVVKGTVEVFTRKIKGDGAHGLEGRPAAILGEFQCDEIIVTRVSSSAIVQFVTGKITVGPKTRLEVANFAPTREPGQNASVGALNLIYGKIRAWAQKRTDESKFEVRTPTAVMGVRGTDFFVGHDNLTHQTDEATLEGKVSVARENSKDAVVVEAGQQVQVSQVEKPIAPEPISEAMKETVKEISEVARGDSDFTAPEAVAVIGQPETWRPKGEPAPPRPEAELDHSHQPRWVIAFGQSDGELKHASSDLNGSGTDANAFSVQKHFPQQDKSYIAQFGISRMKDENYGSTGVKNDLTMLSFEAGIRFEEERWWSPYLRAGFGWQYNILKFNPPGTSEEATARREYVAFVASAGLDGIYNPPGWKTVGLYGAFEGQINQTLLAGKRSLELNSSGEPDTVSIKDQSLGLWRINFLAGIVGYW